MLSCASINPAVSKVLGWDLTKPKQFLVNRQGMDPVHVQDLEREYKRFLALRLLDLDAGKFPISNTVDEIWHAHILYTEDYARMGTEVFGRPVHHLPAVTDAERDALEPYYHNNTMRVYREHFGKPDPIFWPEHGDICWSCM